MHNVSYRCSPSLKHVGCILAQHQCISVPLAGVVVGARDDVV